ncbi:hypothetical protein AYO20_11457 [Fonsecaea nubica]|uniref:FAD-dependent oxidoreductase 2 FAD-binding domain-containing protein n=1 Tax=Fonsecaea nubica TaxID=856822 RepID=A0A178BTK3_9EURO|nr:hypothetical protein AYO20_11457 [Fonsecaea nubica]OAL20930.1 hypothetical protein AYO20_11457 [Fonsecaea nubica]
MGVWVNIPAPLGAQRLRKKRHVLTLGTNETHCRSIALSVYRPTNTGQCETCSTQRPVIQSNSKTKQPSHSSNRQYAAPASSRAALSDYDVIVVGFGVAGASAAIAAAEMGRRVLILDRENGGGASALSGGVVYSGGGTRQQEEAGHGHDTPEEMYKYLAQEIWGPGIYPYPSSPAAALSESHDTRKASGAVDEKTLKAFCDGSKERLEWLERHGATFRGSLCPYKTSYPTDNHYLYYSGNEKAWPYANSAQPHPRGHRTVAKGLSSGNVLWSSLRDAVLKLGVEVRPFSRVERLSKGGSTTLPSISLRSVDRHEKVFKKLLHLQKYKPLNNWFPPLGKHLQGRVEALWQGAAKEQALSASAVILAAGGFVFNEKMVQEHLSKYRGAQPLGTPGDNGSGILLGQSVGGVTTHMDRMSCWRFLSPPETFLHGVAVDMNGKRIINEDLYGAQFTEGLVHRAHGRGFLILDASLWKRAQQDVKSQAAPFQKLQTWFLFTVGHEKADTLDSLARKIGVSIDGLRETINSYNEGIFSGAGEPFHKAPSLSTPLTQGPFYALDVSLVPRRGQRIWPAPAITLGGLRVHGDSGLLLNEFGEEIPGVYAAGRTAAGICANNYVSGLSLADGVFSGIRAGRHAAWLSSKRD